jgi:hypothetical protein
MYNRSIYLILFILVLGLTTSSIARGALVEDDFEANTIDLSKWQLINGPGVSITQSGGRLFFDRPVLQLNYLATADQFDPAANPLTITGSVTLATNGDMDVWTRADIIANTGGGPTHVLDSGIRINFWQDAVDSGYPPNLDILEKTPGVWPWDSSISDGANIPGDDEAVDWEFVITDDGTTITATFTQTSDLTNTLTLTGTCTTDFNTDYVAFTVTGGYLNDVTIRTGGPYPYASLPDPPDGTLHPDTWVSLSWKPGGLAVSHDIYLGDNFDDVNDASHQSETFRGNQGLAYFVAGFSGFPYPDGLVNGTTYYWRIDEVNDADPNSPWKGEVWSFTVPPNTAYEPVPANGAEFVELNAQLTWTPGFSAKLHYIVFGEDFDQVNNAVTGSQSSVAKYNPGPLKLAKTYYWRVDESDGVETYRGEVWSFTTAGAVSGPSPADGAVDVKPSVVLSWDAGTVAASHEVFFGTVADAVKNATIASPEYKGPKALGEESYDPGKLTLNTTYYWRIDEVNDVSPDSPWTGNVWSFTTGDFFVIDDFEDYDAGENQIWYSWHDGLGYGVLGTDPYYAGNGTGAAIGDETTPSYTEETIVHGGGKSMPVSYDNNKQGYSKYSEVEYTLTNQRDWTEEGVTELSLWFRGYPAPSNFIEGQAGTYTMTGTGADIWDIGPGAGEYHDEFNFAYKMLTGPGSIVAKVESVQNTNAWAKAGVMIRETLDGGSKHAFAAVTPANGVAFQGRIDPGGASFNTNQTGFTAPYWVKLERDAAGNFAAYHSANGSTWQLIQQGPATNIPMTSNVYVGLAITSHDAALRCEAVFSNVTITGSVSGQWAYQDIGIITNDAEPLYVAVSNTAGTPAVVINDDPAAATIDTWTEWVIPLQAFADQGINLTNVDRIAVGLGTKGNITMPGGSGKMLFDDIRLYRPREAGGE